MNEKILIDALETISKYGADGICPYGCDTPDIAKSALTEYRNAATGHNSDYAAALRVLQEYFDGEDLASYDLSLFESWIEQRLNPAKRDSA